MPKNIEPNNKKDRTSIEIAVNPDKSNDVFGVSKHVETVCLLINQNAKAKHHVNVGLDAEDYYKIKDGKKD
ncbi:MAG: hypothetical protein LIR50_12350 [Bacillota bacterium]|nr:hypothetical protein [Bacillota bacterium]